MATPNAEAGGFMDAENVQASDDDGADGEDLNDGDSASDDDDSDEISDDE